MVPHASPVPFLFCGLKDGGAVAKCQRNSRLGQSSKTHHWCLSEGDALDLNFPAASVPVNSYPQTELPWKVSPPTRGHPYRGFGQDLPCLPSTVARVERCLTSPAEEPESTKIPTNGSASLFRVKHCGI